MLKSRIAVFVLALIPSMSLGQGMAPPVAAPKPPTPQTGDIQLVERLLAARRDYQATLEQLRAYYQSASDMERMAWAEEELKQYHRIPKRAFRLELDVPPPTLQASQNIPEANELFRRAMTYKDKGWGTDYIDNQHRAEILLQQILSQYPQSDKIDDAAYQLGDIYEGKVFKQYRRSAQYFERCYEWNPNTQHDARLRAARIYDKVLNERSKAAEIYKTITTHETDTKILQEAGKRLQEIAGR